METIKTCPVCGSDFAAKRSTAVYCSPACRKASQRKRQLEEDSGHLIQVIKMAPPRPVKPKPATVDNIADAVMMARAASTSLNRYALSCAPALRAICLKAALGIDEALREAGL